MRPFNGLNELKDYEYIFTPRNGGIVFSKIGLIKEQIHSRKYLWSDDNFKIISLKEMVTDPLFRYYTHHIDIYYDDILNINKVFENNIKTFDGFNDYKEDLKCVSNNLLNYIL